MDKIENIKLMNDLVIRTERGELIWEKTSYAGVFLLQNGNGQIEIAKSTAGNIIFKIIGGKGDVLTDQEYFKDRAQDLQVYKISHVLWSLVKDLSSDSKIDFKEILDLLDEDNVEEQDS
ncbi:MAG: hypothetical protein OCD02_10545 [Spirochaetaceae bacterium]